jgi:hypothetical protein
LAAPLFLWGIRFARGQPANFDFLMPAELFPVALFGGGLLLWAALRARLRRGLIGWCLVAAVVLLVGGQGLAIVSGLASGEIGPTSPWMVVVMASILLYALALAGLGVGGALLLRDLFKAEKRGTN